MYKFSYFTQRANEALNFAIKSAEEFGHNYVGSEHILLGLLKTDGGIALNTLEEKGITAEDVENLIKEYIGQGMQTKLTPDDFTPRTKRVLDVAFQYARSMRRSFVDTEHLLMAVLQEGDSYAVKFINSFGIDEQNRRTMYIQSPTHVLMWGSSQAVKRCRCIRRRSTGRRREPVHWIAPK